MPLYGEKKKEYDRKWMANKRTEFFKDKLCATCGVNSATGLHGGRVMWSARLDKLEEAAKKYKVLCDPCGFIFTKAALKTASTRHGHSKKSPTYISWEAMRRRCKDEKHDAYPYYGGRGVTVCKEWDASFEVFLAHVGERPSGTTLDRIDPNGNYEPGNCRWATKEVQGWNRRKNKRLQKVA